MVTEKPDAKKATSSRSQNVTTEQTEEKTVTPPAPEPTKPVESAPSAKTHDATDVQAALARHTFDGKGEAAVPPSNFKGFATEGVEKKPLKSVDEVAQEVLNGTWGTNAKTVAEKLSEAGYDVLEVEKEFNKRRAAGAPSAF